MSDLLGSVGFGVLTWVALYLAKRANYFTFPKQGSEWEVPVRWYHVATVFAIYFVAVTTAVPIIARLIQPAIVSSPPISALVWLNFLTSFLILGGILLYTLSFPRGLSMKIWKRNEQNSLFKSLTFAFFSFLIAFPLVIFINEALDLFLSVAFGIEVLPEQLAVRFLKMTFEYPRYFFLSVVTIVVLAPVLEEILFRGFLQSFIKKHLGAKVAIALTSLCFSFFHYSPEQGISNLSIIGSLFALSLFVGFVYEKQGALSAPIFLHASFNAVSVLNLYFLGGLSLTS
jgi:hypothetical protein